MEIPKQFDDAKALCRRLAARGTPEDNEAAGMLAAFIYRLMIAEPKVEALFAEGIKIGGDLDVVLADNVKLRARLAENATVLQQAKEHLDENGARIARLTAQLAEAEKLANEMRV
jgi:hypothetical protein